MSSRRCEYCRRKLPIGMRIDAFFCSDNCRINAHKKKKRDFQKEGLLQEQPRPIVSFPFTKSWQTLVEQMQRSCPVGGSVPGYRLKKKGSIFPNPENPFRIVDGEIVSLLYYRWRPFEPPSVPEVGEYQLQWCLDGEFYAAAFDSEDIPTCLVSIADPQACFHNNRVTRQKLTNPAWKRQVNSKLKPFAAEIKAAKKA